MKAERAAAAAKAEARREKNGGTAPRGGKHDDADEEPRAPGDTRPRKNRAKIAAKKATEEAAKSERRGSVRPLRRRSSRAASVRG